MGCTVFKSRDYTLREQLAAMGSSPNPNTPDSVLDRVRPGGIVTFACGSAEMAVCRCGHLADILCDWPTERGKTCDLPLCSECATKIGEDRDLCGIHFAMFAKKAEPPRVFDKGPRIVR